MSRNIGIVGLGTMGTMVGRRLARSGYALSLFNRHVPNSEEQIPQTRIESYAEFSDALGFEDLSAFVNSLESPRILLLLVDAGAPTEQILQELTPLLQPGDVVIDGGNAHYDDTARRCRELKEKGIHFLGCGISGSGDAVNLGLSLMPGGSQEAYAIAAEPLKALAARSVDGTPCCVYISDEGAGHFVKTVHNGIEYAEMQLIAEVYSLLRWALELTPTHIADVLANWKNTDAHGYLLDITLNILREKKDDQWVLDTILDSAGQKGTGVWAVQAAASFGIPAMMITSALHARYLSGQRHIRKHLSEVTDSSLSKNAALSTNDIYVAFQLARLINYHEGFAIIRAAAQHYGWTIDLAALSKIWTNGCIIRSALMNKFVILWSSWQDELILHDDVKSVIKSGWPGLRRILQVASFEAIFTPCLMSASQYIAGASLRYPAANLIAAQRDYFGNHGFWSIDDPSGKLHHYPWKRD
jgi:6-phosphogluconate dehydrogenase